MIIIIFYDLTRSLSLSCHNLKWHLSFVYIYFFDDVDDYEIGAFKAKMLKVKGSDLKTLLLIFWFFTR